MDKKEIFVCVECSETFERTMTRGKKPTRCPDCYSVHRAQERSRSARDRRAKKIHHIRMSPAREIHAVYTAMFPDASDTYNSDYGSAVRKENNLRKKYGISLRDFIDMWIEQEGLCLGCDRSLFDTGHNVDHCHESGNPRGILCPDCNRGLGCAKDSVESLKKWIAYLEDRGEHGWRRIRRNQSSG